MNCRFYQFALLSLLSLLLLLSAEPSWSQSILVPAYSPTVAKRALTESQGARVKVILNPASGPGLTKDAAYGPLFGPRVLAYVDLMAWPDDGLVKVTTARVKTLMELTRERDLYQSLYGHTSGWFFDDATPQTQGLLRHLAKWDGEKVLNPGTKTPAQSGFVTIQHEGPDFFDAWLPTDAGERSVAGAIALKLREADVAKAWKRAAGMKYFYAHQLADDWKAGATAYTSLPSYWPTLLKLAR